MHLTEERRGSTAISYVYEPGSYVPLARLDADGEQTEQGGLGTTQDAQQPGTSNPELLAQARQALEPKNTKTTPSNRPTTH